MVNRSKKALIWTDTIASGARNLMGKEVSRALSGATANQIKMAGSTPMIPMKNGSKGTIKKKKQPAMLHQGEVVLTAKQVKSLKRILK